MGAPQMHYVASRANAGVARASAGLVRPSGVLSVATVTHAQGILVYLGHLPRSMSSITGAVDTATRGAIAAFQDNFNRENACRRHDPGAPCQPGRVYGVPFQPHSLTVNGDLTPDTRAALGNYVGVAQAGRYGLNLSRDEIDAMGAAVGRGVGSGPAAVTAPLPAAPAPAAPAPAAPVPVRAPVTVAQAPVSPSKSESSSYYFTSPPSVASAPAPVTPTVAPPLRVIPVPTPTPVVAQPAVVPDPAPASFPIEPLLAVIGVAVIIATIAWTQSGTPAQPKYLRKAR